MPGLIYYPDSEPGITRIRRGKGFSYVASGGDVIRDQEERARLNALAVPPAYGDVWMCPMPNGHLQATGRDARDRKQYIYHPDWTAARAQAKFEGLATFGTRLPRIRRRVDQDLCADAGERDFALAAAVTLIDRAALRVGNPQYAEENGSYGALSLRNRHLCLDGSEISLRYRGKGGRNVKRRMTDAKLARILGKINDLPGATLLSWLDDDGAPQRLTSDALNAYLAEAGDLPDATAKTFRTWAGTCAAFAVAEDGEATISAMAEAASATLHNTPKIARESYIHPAVIDLAGAPAPAVTPQALSGLRVGEQRLLGYLKSLDDG